MNEIAIVVNYLISQVGNKVFFPDYSAVKDNCFFFYRRELRAVISGTQIY